MQFEKIQYLDYEGNLSKDFKREISNEDLVKMYKVMHLTRRIDERCITLQRQGVINFVIGSRGGRRLCSGQCRCFDQRRLAIFSISRTSRDLMARSESTQEYMDHMLLNENDPSLGRQMSNHYGKRELNSVTVSSTLATQMPNAAGAAYAVKIRNEPNVSLCYLAEGSASEGDFHAGVHMGAVRRVPCIFFCRNNKCAYFNFFENQYRGDGIVPRSIGWYSGF